MIFFLFLFSLFSLLALFPWGGSFSVYYFSESILFSPDTVMSYFSLFFFSDFPSFFYFTGFLHSCEIGMLCTLLSELSSTFLHFGSSQSNQKSFNAYYPLRYSARTKETFFISSFFLLQKKEVERWELCALGTFGRVCLMIFSLMLGTSE